MTSTLMDGLLPFQHEPYFNYADPAVADAQRAAFRDVRARYVGRTFPLLLDGQPVEGPSTFEVRNPADTREVVWHFQSGTAEQREQAVAGALRAFETWQFSDPLQRASIFLRAAQLLRARRMEFNAVMTLENAKNWAEADGEVAECVDHFEIFARETLKWAQGKAVSPMPTEHVTTVYEPLGVVVVISPWNYPGAIPLGMALGAIAAGNTVVWKPASETPLSSLLLVELLHEAGLPRGVIQFVTGSDDVYGDPLVDHKDVRMIAFTGSKEIGSRIYERAAKVQPGQRWLKRVIAEMGGKGATVVCADADLDAAATGIVQAAFGYAGQKCSACSRVIAEDRVYDALLEKVKALTEQLTVGLPEDNAPVGPVIHAGSAQRILGYLERGQQTARLVTGGARADMGDAQGGYLQPTIFADVPSSDPLFQEEIFGPVLAFTRAADWQDAIRLSNDSEYGLTSSFYSRDPLKIAEARRRMHVGNLYINRKCTGALSGTHAFGGYGMSGTNAKVGGPDYLFWFVQTKTVAQAY
ncbi:L-glutamate gamma-semialdehyde dehydrogenase [Deinococcus maricopensis]|uniref:L-glutamate gamma-semialdehyde dehydrogenase n=1 Tax=Deinococcus maricopensis (strain DSM 21211 / LMG 22137 / NRRL B-23946 / LB-34) TaxID=709986 RepID=E8U992_DEIML|nr:L-glutamate gamma-semialdehyde dehydrogenase [Deinococcus maricopensis]ADV67631.1 1-pyrroline-5-carboxylate dehydrogenase [Deinococcus maricopensis DSM 21211]